MSLMDILYNTGESQIEVELTFGKAFFKVPRRADRMRFIEKLNLGQDLEEFAETDEDEDETDEERAAQVAKVVTDVLTSSNTWDVVDQFTRKLLVKLQIGDEEIVAKAVKWDDLATPIHDEISEAVLDVFIGGDADEGKDSEDSPESTSTDE